MQAANGARLVDRLRREIEGHREHYPPFEIGTDRYLSEAWLARERAALFGAPQIATTSSSIAVNGCAPYGPDVITRGADGIARGFANACRHRGTRLIDAPCTAKAMVCPYHGWTYDLAGALVHVPHDDTFAGVDLARRHLIDRPITERHGLVWRGRDIETYLGELDGDVAALRFDQHVVYRSGRATRACNWKLVIEAFLDGYHIRILHRDSIYRFFVDAASVSEPAGRHIRALTARRTLRDRATGDLRKLGTPSFVLFPATVVIAHPDFISIITLYPLAPDRTEYHHQMLVPADRAGETEHWDRSWELIENTVFQREDLWVCEQAQRGMATGAIDTLLFGALENPVRWFHASIDRALVTA